MNIKRGSPDGHAHTASSEVAVSQGTARSTSVDFLRGLSLIVIALDHIPESALAHLTPHVYAYFDAAEVFVFLGGYASAAAYCTMTAGGVAAQARRRFLKRTVELYRAYLLTAGLMLLAGLAMLALRVHTVGVEALFKTLRKSPKQIRHARYRRKSLPLLLQRWSGQTFYPARRETRSGPMPLRRC